MLDSLHIKDHVLKELRLYSKFVSKNSYLIVQDTIINGHPARPDYGPGPMEAVQEFLKENKDFEIDRELERQMLTYYPSGFSQAGEVAPLDVDLIIYATAGWQRHGLGPDRDRTVVVG